MAKRRATVQSDDSDVEPVHQSSTPSKRPRVGESRDEESRDEDAPQSPPRIKDAKGKGKMLEVVVQSDDEEDDENALDARLDASRISNDQDDADFEAQNEAIIMDAISKRDKKKGSVASMGIIESIEMHQFMCHPRLSFKFGPQVNFIIGHNGSGKSAVLSALTIALGGKAIATGRGNGLKAFIREGQNVAEVTIGIKNHGDEAFRPELYGKTIYVTRRFTKEGSSSYKIKSAEGRLISTKRDELSAICDHMNIQVDNPINILTQDSARRFLSVSHPTDKYQFFLKGTQLTQLSDEYETCLENIGKTARTLQLKREEIPDLEKAFKEADARNNEANKAREKKSKLAEYKRELAWAHVKAKENQMSQKIEEVAKERRRLPKIEGAIANADAEVEKAGLKIVELNAEADAMSSIDVVKAEQEDLDKQIKRNKDDIIDCKANEREMNQQMGMLRNRIKEFEDEIAKVTAKLQGNTQDQREEIQRKLQAAEAQRVTIAEEVREFPERLGALRAQLSRDESQGRQAEGQVSKLRRDIETTVANIERCKNRTGDDLSSFGRNLPSVLTQIGQERWAGEVPAGPFGRFVSVKDPKWAPVMRAQLGGIMSSFAVTNNRDRYKLKKILDQHGNGHVHIIVSDVDLFDYSHGEPPENCLTVLRALEVKDEFIKRILINMRSIEKVSLASTRAEGDQVLLDRRGGGLAWSADGYIARRYAEGGATSTPMAYIKPNDPRQHMFTGTDRSADIRHGRWENDLRGAEDGLKEAMATEKMCQQRYRNGKVELQKLEAQERTLRQRLSGLNEQIIRLKEEALEEAPMAIVPLEEAKEEAKQEQKSIEEQYQNVVQRRLDLDSTNIPLVQRHSKLGRRIIDWQAKETEMTEKIEAAMHERVKALAHKKHWESKLAEEKENVAYIERVAEVLQTEFADWSVKAEKIGARYDNPRKPEVVSRQIESAEKALQQHERRQGATPEEIAIERDNAKNALDNHLRQLEEVSKLNKALKTSLALRMGKWVTFRQHIALRCKYQFQHHLWTRGYYGKVIFDHNAGTLNLKVQTDDQASTQSKDKDPKSLSGGEKSYSTICLLLALWESIQCPLRCLDEFDVFMDSVNRRISMKMMVEAANTSDKQYILITPQDMSHVALGPTVRVHRMSDPERNQNSLQF